MIDPRTMSGLDFLRATFAHGETRAAIFETMGMLDATLSEGKAEIRARADSRHLNPLGGVHGGFAATVMDSVTGCALHTLLEPGLGFVTIDLAIKMLRPVPVDQEVIAEATVSHRSKSLGVSQGTLRTVEGKLLASATATLFIRPL